MKGFNPASTPSYRMGWFAEYVRLLPGSVRSGHPQTSFAANGPRAARLMDGHDLRSHLGEQSPLAKLYESNAAVLLLGVGFAVCTALHLAEYRLRSPRPERRYRCYLEVDGHRRLCEFEAADLDDSVFPQIGRALEETARVSLGRVGAAEARLVAVRDAVDFAAAWMNDRDDTLDMRRHGRRTAQGDRS